MDIKIAVTRIGIFLLIYTIILGFPLYIGYKTTSWILSTFLAVILATIGPLTYRIWHKKAEELLLTEQRRYQKLLLKSAKGMIREHDLGKLIRWIVYVVRRTVGIRYAALFLDDKEKELYALKAKQDNGEIPHGLVFSYKHPFIEYMQKKREPFFYEEVPLPIRNSLNIPFEINIIIPSFVEGNHLGFLILGEKLNRELYSEDDLNVFKILSNQAGLAIENAKLYSDLQNETKILRRTIKQLKETQDQLIQSEKLATVGEMAAGVAHEINNPLAAISGEAEMLLMEKNKDKDTKYASKVIMEQTKRIKTITERLLEFSKKKGFQQESLDVNELVKKSLFLLSYHAELSGVKIVRDLGNNLPKLLGDNSQLQEVFLNIMLNAVQSMEGRKILTVRTYADISKHGQRIVAIEFKDTGKGIKEEVVKKLFDPFFSTKKQGTGLGLSIAYGIIGKHRGNIEVHSKVGEGSNFIVKLPA